MFSVEYTSKANVSVSFLSVFSVEYTSKCIERQNFPFHVSLYFQQTDESVGQSVQQGRNVYYVSLPVFSRPTRVKVFYRKSSFSCMIFSVFSERLQECNNNYHNNNRIQRRYSRSFTISSLLRELSPTRTLKWPGRNRVQITCNTSSAYHVQHVVLRATWYEGTAQPLSLTELKSHVFELYFVG